MSSKAHRIHLHRSNAVRIATGDKVETLCTRYRSLSMTVRPKIYRQWTEKLEKDGTIFCANCVAVLEQESQEEIPQA